MIFVFFFYLGFLSRTFTFHGTAGEGGGFLFNSSLPLPPASQALRHQPGDYCRELTSAHSWQPGSNREPLVSERKSLMVSFLGKKLTSLFKKIYRRNVIYRKLFFFQMLAVIFMRKATNMLPVNFLRRTFRSHKAKVLSLHFLTAENRIDTYRTILSFHFQECWENYIKFLATFCGKLSFIYLES